MKSFLKFVIILFFSAQYCYAQDTTINITPANYNPTNEIYLASLNGWHFKEGNDTAWAKKDIDLTGWKLFKPVDLSASMADKNGRLEGWFRIKIKLNGFDENAAMGFRYMGWAAADIYIDGNLFGRFGNSGTDRKSFREYMASNRIAPPFPGKYNGTHTIAVHFTDYRSTFPTYNLKSADNAGLPLLFRLTGPEYQQDFAEYLNVYPSYLSAWFSVLGILMLLFWLLAFLNKREVNLKLFAVLQTMNFLLIFYGLVTNGHFSYITTKWVYIAFAILVSSNVIIFVVTMSRIFNKKIGKLLKYLIVAYVLINLTTPFYFNTIVSLITYIFPLIIYGYFVIAAWKTVSGAQWAIVIGITSWMLFAFLYFAMVLIYQTSFIPYALVITSATLFSFPLSVLVYIAMRFKEIIIEVQQNAAQVYQLSEEKRDLAIKQQKILEEEVARQTQELRTSFANLESTQAQLIQSEKMASLGELTAGIAHEIQNPLNFVNNFSEVNKELLVEMKDEMNKGNWADANEIANDIIANEEKINHHGKRADAIVKGMLQHSQSTKGQKEPTDINALCDEYLRLSYHGLRAKDKSFNANMKTEFDENIGSINIIPQDIGRVILNLITNAFYVVNEKSKQGIAGYEPTVEVRTKKFKDKVEVKVQDNGNGIPQNIVDKIFQPFFTTKPTGQGTGLGLSLSYDIIKAHGGQIKVETIQGEGTIFIIHLPN